MKLLLNLLINGFILYLASEPLGLIRVDSFSTAVFLSLVMALITFLIRMVVVPLKFFGCLTLGISYLAGVILSLFAIPIALYQAAHFVKGVQILGAWETIVLGFLITVSNYILMGRIKKD